MLVGMGAALAVVVGLRVQQLLPDWAICALLEAPEHQTNVDILPV
jgi:hypothetical protein